MNVGGGGEWAQRSTASAGPGVDMYERQIEMERCHDGKYLATLDRTTRAISYVHLWLVTRE